MFITYIDIEGKPIHINGANVLTVRPIDSDKDNPRCNVMLANGHSVALRGNDEDVAASFNRGLAAVSRGE
jgi:hypothetical protein